MGDLRIENPATTEQFIEALQRRQVKLPLRISDEFPGQVDDDDGDAVLVIDANCERCTQDVMAITTIIVLAVNTCGGFKAVAA